METDPTPEFEYLNYALDELEDYLLSGELFWPVTIRPSSGGSFLKLTVGNLLSDIKKDYERQAPYYQHEVRLRVLLELLQPHADPEDIDGYELAPMDAFLRGMLKRGEFLWDIALKPGFPVDEYWFLWGSLSQ